MQHFVIQRKENRKFAKILKGFYTYYTLPTLQLGKSNPQERVPEGKGLNLKNSRVFKEYFFEKKN